MATHEEKTKDTTSAPQGDRLAKPLWLKRRIPSGRVYQNLHKVLKSTRLHTVCQEALCPNLGECFSQGTATFMILGDRCTRNCRFCAVKPDPSGPPDAGEPKRIAEAVKQLDLSYVVITSVTRDDLSDGGASLFSETIKATRKEMPHTIVEILIPDFQGLSSAVKTVVDAEPDLINHNIETVPRLYPQVRPQAIYQRSLELLQTVKTLGPKIPTKSGLMLGLGETPGEIRKTLIDIYNTGCRIVTLGQYLQPSKEHLPVKRFIPPEEFDDLRKIGLSIGFLEVASGPFVRSSYHAKKLYQTLNA